MELLVDIEQCNPGGRMSLVIGGKISHDYPVHSIILVMIDIYSEILLQFLVYSQSVHQSEDGKPWRDHS